MPSLPSVQLITSIFPAEDAFFWVGTRGSPESSVTEVSTNRILAPMEWPNKGGAYEYDDQENSSKYILHFFDNEVVTLKIPSTMTV